MNCDENLINGITYKYSNVLSHIKKSIIASPNIKEYGINFIGRQSIVLEVLKTLIIKGNTNVLEPFFDLEEKVFSVVDKWNHTQIFGMLIHFQFFQISIWILTLEELGVESGNEHYRSERYRFWLQSVTKICKFHKNVTKICMFHSDLLCGWKLQILVTNQEM